MTERLHPSELAAVRHETTREIKPGTTQEDSALARIDQARANEAFKLGDTFEARQRRARRYWRHGG